MTQSDRQEFIKVIREYMHNDYTFSKPSTWTISFGEQSLTKDKLIYLSHFLIIDSKWRSRGFEESAYEFIRKRYHFVSPNLSDSEQFDLEIDSDTLFRNLMALYNSGAFSRIDSGYYYEDEDMYLHEKEPQPFFS